MTEPWRIELLGPLRARRGSQQVGRFRTAKTAALLGYLAYEPRAHSREVLLERLWPDSSPQDGRNSLSVALSSLRRQFEPPGVESGAVILAERTFVSLNPQLISTDVAEFTSLLAPASPHSRARLQRAIDLYQGRFLEGLYEDWIVREAQRLEDTFFAALDELIAQLQATGEYQLMQRYAERGLAVGPWREENWRHLLLAGYAQGQQESMLRRYRQWELAFAREFGAPPHPANQDLIIALESNPQLFVQTAHLQAPPPDSIQVNEKDETANTPAIQSTAPPYPSENQEISATPSAGQLLTSQLPLHRTRFFGRRSQINRLLQLLMPLGVQKTDSTTRALVTLTGMGGSGKTRLAVEVSHRLASQYQGRVWFVGLASLAAPELLSDAMLKALQFPLVPLRAPWEQIIEFLAGAPALIVLDNFETLLPGGEMLVANLLARLPNLTCLVTSRQRLGIEGEHEVVVRPLPLPKVATFQARTHFDVTRLLRYAGIRLFVDRAQVARPDFNLTVRNAASVLQLCQVLEGVPLALELAAARSSVLSPSQMLERLEKRLDFLRSQRHDLPERHRSLRATIDWSYRLLTPELQRFFARLWVFRGGWTPEAAEAICEEPRALHYAAQLCACSLLNRTEQAQETRFYLLDTLREFAGDQLSPEERAELGQRHAQFFLEWMQSKQDELNESIQERDLERFEANLDNCREALEWALQNAPELALRLFIALAPFMEQRGRFLEGREWGERVLKTVPDSPTEAYARGLYEMGKLVYDQDFIAARPFFENARERFRYLGARRWEGRLLCLLAKLLMNIGDPAAGQLCIEAREIGRELDDALISREAINSLCNTAIAMGDLETGIPLARESLALSRGMENALKITESLDVLAVPLWLNGEHQEAQELAEEGLVIARQIGHVWLTAHLLWTLGNIHRTLGHLAYAQALNRESLVLIRQSSATWAVPYLLAVCAYVGVEQEDFEFATLLLGAAHAHHTAMHSPLVPVFVPENERYIEKARQALGMPRFNSLWEQGSALRTEEAIAIALGETI